VYNINVISHNYQYYCYCYYYQYYFYCYYIMLCNRPIFWRSAQVRPASRMKIVRGLPVYSCSGVTTAPADPAMRGVGESLATNNTWHETSPERGPIRCNHEIFHYLLTYLLTATTATTTTTTTAATTTTTTTNTTTFSYLTGYVRRHGRWHGRCRSCAVRWADVTRRSCSDSSCRRRVTMTSRRGSIDRIRSTLQTNTPQ